MKYAWESRELYEHPAKHNAGRFGRLVRHASGVYSLMIGNSAVSVPQDFAARSEAEEDRKDRVTITLDGGVLSKLDALAATDHRSRSSLIEHILRERFEK